MVIEFYIALMPVILGGVFNMIFVKTNFYKRYAFPLDFDKNFIDNKRIFGKNKTYIGFISMIIFTSIFQIVWGYISSYYQLTNIVYLHIDNTLINNLYVGAMFGFLYMIGELPNSFIKRRIDIMPGKTASGICGIIFFFADQIDSISVIALYLGVLASLNTYSIIICILVGGFTHISINIILYLLKIRKNI